MGYSTFRLFWLYDMPFFIYGGNMIDHTVSLIKNGDVNVIFYTYFCEHCGKELPECDPKIQLQNMSYSCCDCAFINGDIDEQEYLKVECYWIGTKNSYAYVDKGKIIVGVGGKKRRKERDRRNTPEYSKWRRLVFERDDYTCAGCGSRGGELNAHHIKPYKKHKDLRLEVSNGQTLCVACHRGVHGSN